MGSVFFVTQAVGKAKDGYGAARKTESEKKAELRAVQDKIKAAFTTLEEMGKVRDEEGGGMSTLFEEKKALHDLVGWRLLLGGQMERTIFVYLFHNFIFEALYLFFNTRKYIFFRQMFF